MSTEKHQIDYGYMPLTPDARGSMDRWLPKQPGDEVRCGLAHHEANGCMFMEWSQDDSNKFYSDLVYRRKVDPGDGYQIFGLGDVLPHSFQFTVDGVEWYDINFADSNLTAEEYVRGRRIVAIRRRVKPVAAQSRMLCRNCGSDILLLPDGKTWIHAGRQNLMTSDLCDVMSVAEPPIKKS